MAEKVTLSPKVSPYVRAVMMEAPKLARKGSGEEGRSCRTSSMGAVMAEQNAASGVSVGRGVYAHDLLRAVEDMVSRDPAFLKSLQNLIGGQPGPAHRRASGEDPLCPVLKRLGDVEKRLDGLSREMLHLQQNRPSHVDPEWTTGQGSGQRLTMKGMTKMNRLFEEGLSDTDIRGMMGVSLSTVGKRRRQYDKDVFQESLQSSAD